MNKRRALQTSGVNANRLSCYQQVFSLLIAGSLDLRHLNCKAKADYSLNAIVAANRAPAGCPRFSGSF
jgi:hypothetical protein